MASERAALYRTRWAAPEIIPAEYRMRGGSEIRLKSKIDLYTLQRLLQDLQDVAFEGSWQKLIADECPIGCPMEPLRYSDDDDEAEVQ